MPRAPQRATLSRRESLLGDCFPEQGSPTLTYGSLAKQARATGLGGYVFTQGLCLHPKNRRAQGLAHLIKLFSTGLARLNGEELKDELARKPHEVRDHQVVLD